MKIPDLYCDECGIKLIPITFIDYEYDNNMIKTGRIRRAVSHLTCPECLKNYIVDDSFDSDWWIKGNTK